MDTTKTLSFNPMTGGEFESTDQAIKHFKFLVAGNQQEFLGFLELQFYQTLNNSKNDTDFIATAYSLYQVINSLILSTIEDNQLEIIHKAS